MYVRSMLNIIILGELHIKSVKTFLSYNQDDVKSDIFMELPICFGVEGSQPREWVTRLDKNLYFLKDEVLACFEKPKGDLEDRYFSNHKWTRVYSMKNKWSYYFMLIIA